MWYGLRMFPQAEAAWESSLHELRQSTWHYLILITGVASWTWQFTAELVGPAGLDSKLGWVTLLVTLVCVLTFLLLRRHVLAAQAIWQVGLCAAITLTVYQLQQPPPVFLYALLPLVAVVTLGWPAGLLIEGLLIGLVWWLSHFPAMPSLPLTYALGAVAGGALAGLIGWAATNSLLTVVEWSLFNSRQAQHNLEEAREQRLELKQIQEDLVQANRELTRLSDRLKAMHQVAEEARQAKEQFVANVSHELRTPLNMIIGFSEMITQSPHVYADDLPPTLLADIAAIQRNSQHLAKLVDDVLDLSQVEAGRMALSKEWASLQEIIGTAALAVRPLFESKGLYLETDVPADLPSLFCDATRIRQVIINLLSNAGRFTERGGVQVRAWHQENQAVISVTDTGPGITREAQNRLFEPFQQLDGSIRRSYGGTGLGLSISKRFAEMHGGTMWLESELGVGSRFYLSLPLETAVPADLTASSRSRRWVNPYHQYEARTRRSKAPIPTRRPRFVLLEKGNTLQRLLARYMDEVEIACVENLREAMQELDRAPAQALVVNKHPLEATPSPQELADLPYKTPAITCWVPGEDQAARRLGVVRYLIKPVTREMLLSTIEGLGGDVRSVLLVDDEPEVLQLFTRMLSSPEHGYRVLQATSGQRGLTLLRQRQPDVVLLDLIMPGMDGFLFLEEKSQDASIRDVPVVVVSSRDPLGEPVASDGLAVTRAEGLSVRDLLGCIQALSEVLSPVRQSAGQGQPETPAVSPVS